MNTILRRRSIAAVIAATIALAGCAGTPNLGETAADELAYVEPDPTVGEAPLQAPQADRPDLPTPPDDPSEPVSVEPAVQPEPTIVDLPSTSPPLCVATVPSDPAPNATGVVQYQLVDGWAQYSYGAIYIIDAAGESALSSGLPSVRNGDSFDFIIDDSMTDTAGTWTITTSINGEFTEPCEIRLSNLPTITAIGSGSGGY